jgi:hypothetical protein
MNSEERPVSSSFLKTTNELSSWIFLPNSSESFVREIFVFFSSSLFLVYK